MPDLGIGEALTALLATIGTGAGVEAAALPAEIGLSSAFGAIASDAAIAGGAGLGAGLGATEAGLAATGLGAGLGAGSAFGSIASDAAIAGGAGGAGLGATEAGLGSAFGAGLISDAAGGSTIAEGIPLASTYGPVSAFGAEAGLAAGDAALGGAESGLAAGAPASAFGGIASDAAGGATIAQGVPLASSYGATAPFAADAVTAAPGIASSGQGLASNAGALGSVSPTAPGPGAAAFTPPTTAAGQSIDLTSSFAGNPELASGQGGSLFSGATDTASTGAGAGATPLDTTLSEGAAGTLPGQTATAAETQPAVDALSAEGGLPGGAPPVGPGTPSFLDKAGTYVSDHPFQAISTGVSALGLGHSLLSANKPNPIPGQADLAALAKSLGTTGTSLIAPNASNATAVASHAQDQAKTMENYLANGTLPPAVQASLDRATQSAITDIKAKYASRGMPPGSTAEQMDIASIRQSAVIQGGTLAAQLYSQGVSQDQLASQIYQGLVGAGSNAAGAAINATESGINTNLALNNATNSAIANLSSALGGGSRAIVNGNTVTLPAAA